MTISKFCYKPDWSTAQKRWDAYWERAAVDRPCMVIYAPRPDGEKIDRLSGSLEDRWMSSESVLADSLAYLESTYFGGEAVPHSPHFMAGTTTGCGDNLHFHEGGISIRPSMESMDQPLDWHPGTVDPWRAKVDAICNRLLDGAPGRYIVSRPGQYPHVDLLNMIRGNTEMLMDIVLDPESTISRLREMREPAYENLQHFQDLLDSRQGDVGTVAWTGIWCRERMFVSQADVAAMISPEVFEQIVLPELDWWSERYDTFLFHTCGYKQHLELCLSRPYMKAIQYSPSVKEEPNGPAHIEFYRRIQEAGRRLDLQCPVENVEYLVRHLNPEGLSIGTRVQSVDEAEELLVNAVGWAGSHVNRESAIT